MATFAVAHMHSVEIGPAIVEYLQRIDATLAPYGGRFIVHGGAVEVIEGRWDGNLIVIEFATRQHAHAWYASAAYREILPLRIEHSVSDAILVDTVSADHRATDVLAGH
jgi:uncharacterized protein (DUF1330 family)